MSAQPLTYTGGPLATHAYLLPVADGGGDYLCIDAPDGLATEIRAAGLRVRALLLTHAHKDHTADAARIASDHGCPVYLHAAETAQLWASEPTLSVVELVVAPEGGSALEIGGRLFNLAHIPGHSPGSVTFYEPQAGRIFSGDVLFAEGIGRTKTPEAREELIAGIVRDLLPLPDATEVYPGHGASLVLGDHKARFLTLV